MEEGRREVQALTVSQEAVHFQAMGESGEGEAPLVSRTKMVEYPTAGEILGL